MNRYTNITAAQYNPMSLEELMAVPMLKRQRHDELLNNVAATQSALAQTDYMDMHEDKVLGIRKELEERLQRQVDEVSANGISDSLRTDFMGLNADYQNAIGPKGTLGMAQTAKQQLEAEKATYMAHAAPEYGAEIAGANWQKHEAAYRESQMGADGISNIDGLYAPKYYNVVDEFNKFADRAGITIEGEELLKNSIQFDDSTGMFYLQEDSFNELTESNKEQLKKVERWISNNLNNPNSDLSRSIAHQNKSKEDALKEIQGLSGIMTKEKNVRSDDKRISNLTAPAKETGVQGHEGSLNYELEEAEAIVLQDTEEMDMLNGLLTNPHYNAERATDSGWILELLGFDSSNEQKKQVLTNLENEFTRLKKHLPALEGLDFNTKEGKQALLDYKKKNTNLLRQNVIITDDFVTTYGDSSVGTEKTNASKMRDLILQEAQFRKYEIDGEVFTYDELPDEVKENFNEEGLKYSGYYSPKNFLAYRYGSDSNKNMFASPIAASVTLEDGERVNMRISRSEGEMQRPSYRADQSFNDVFINTNSMPNIPYTVQGTDGKIQVEYNTTAKGYIIRKINDDNTIQVSTPMSSDKLQASFYKLYGVQPNTNKK